MRFSLLLAALLLFAGCRNNEPTLFTALDADDTHITFANTITETAEQNVMQYEYTYNGGGVAIGDLNNDGFADVYFTGNQVPNKLYLNKGKQEAGQLVFDDITQAAGVAGRPGHWKTGVTMADVNGDGWLDLYVSAVSNYKGLEGSNELYINNHDGTFTLLMNHELPAASGIARAHGSTGALQLLPPAMLTVVGAGLAAYGVYALVNARYRKM